MSQEMSERGASIAAVAFVVGVLVLFIGGFLLGGHLGENTGEANARDAERRSAIEAGAAEWVVDPKTGATEFRYKTPEAKP